MLSKSCGHVKKEVYVFKQARACVFFFNLHQFKNNYMKKYFMLFLPVLFGVQANAQQTASVFVNNPFPKTITVSGSAEMEIVPDQIFVNVELKEYQKKRGGTQGYRNDKKPVSRILQTGWYF